MKEQDNVVFLINIDNAQKLKPTCDWTGFEKNLSQLSPFISAVWKSGLVYMVLEFPEKADKGWVLLFEDSLALVAPEFIVPPEIHTVVIFNV